MKLYAGKNGKKPHHILNLKTDLVVLRDRKVFLMILKGAVVGETVIIVTADNDMI